MRGDILGNYSTGADNGTIADSDTLQYCDPKANPDIIADSNWSAHNACVEDPQGDTFLKWYRELGPAVVGRKAMGRVIYNKHIIGDQALVANDDTLFGPKVPVHPDVRVPPDLNLAFLLAEHSCVHDTSVITNLDGTAPKYRVGDVRPLAEHNPS